MEEEGLMDINIFGDIDATPVITDPLELFFQEIALGVKIGPGEIWGIYDSIDLQKYLFNQYTTINKIKNEVQSFIADNCPHASLFQFETDAKLLTVDGKELIYIVVKVYTDDGAEFLNKFMLGQ